MILLTHSDNIKLNLVKLTKKQSNSYAVRQRFSYDIKKFTTVIDKL
jgi:hypothetical protein